MPSMNIYVTENKVKLIENILPGLKEFTVKELSCKDRNLDKNEISIRILIPAASSQIADTEIEILAFSYPERIEKQDKICISIKDYIKKHCANAGSVYVWLSLNELGHSSKE